MEIKDIISTWLKENLKNSDLDPKDNLELYFKNKPLCFIEIFSPSIPLEHPDHLEKVADKARDLRKIGSRFNLKFFPFYLLTK